MKKNPDFAETYCRYKLFIKLETLEHFQFLVYNNIPMTNPYSPTVSAKISMSVVLTNSSGCSAVALTAASPTTPIA